ncbi:unnamed protein product [Diatraea saccharalis]|uniref:Uncharacterized protein n=1 Tax=Diatraea saccharalis TaxID=40085 RepID=A0A9N9WAZ2_9NEOP|nr:unnamed protein product [Diatraea saccharalis]
MLCPEISNFPLPKVITCIKENEDFDFIQKSIRMNNFYESVILTCPHEMNVPNTVQEKILEDNEYYRVESCSITEFLVPTFIESFVKNGRLYCLSVNRNCIIENCAAITPEGILTLHLLKFVYQSLGLEGTKRNHDFYEIELDLKKLRHIDKFHSSLSKLEPFDFNILWEPNNVNVCPSSIAKYFDDRGVSVALSPLVVKKISSTITEIPVLQDVPINEMHEWIGMLAHKVSMDQKEAYISSYEQPNSDNALRSNRISIIIVKGFFTPTIIEQVCQSLTEYVSTKDIKHYWASCSFQSCDNCPWRWKMSSPVMFQSHDCSCSIFITNKSFKMYSIGQLKYS